MITQIPLYKVRSSLQFRVAWVRQLKLYRSVGAVMTCRSLTN